MISAFGPLSMVVLIFGGCCSNVFALEAIIRNEPTSGLLITFFQFYFTALAAFPSQFSASGQYFVRKPLVPVRKWALAAAMFWGVNMLNNWAFAYNISVPVHIILRSFGSVSTMLAGVVRGKTYSVLQVLSVGILTTGVLISAWADSASKGKSMSIESNSSSSEFTTGLSILLLAQCLSAYMSAYVEDIYAEYGASWTENLFYGHFLSLPLFLPFAGILRDQYAKLAMTPHLDVRPLASSIRSTDMPPAVRDGLERSMALLSGVPQGLFYLFVNAVTQLACISGVNLLSAKSSAVTVTIVLNIRKLVSFILSTILFGHSLGALMVLGSLLVFGSGALYGWETSWRLPQARKRSAKSNGSAHGSKKQHYK